MYGGVDDSPRVVRARRGGPAVGGTPAGDHAGGPAGAAAAGPVLLRAGRHRRPRRRGGGHRPAGAAARPGRPRGVGWHAAPGDLRDRRAGSGTGHRPAAAGRGLELAHRRAGRVRGGVHGDRRYRHADHFDPLRRPRRPAQRGRPGDPGILAATVRRPRAAPGVLVRAARVDRRAAAAGRARADQPAVPARLTGGPVVREPPAGLPQLMYLDASLQGCWALSAVAVALALSPFAAKVRACSSRDRQLPMTCFSLVTSSSWSLIVWICLLRSPIWPSWELIFVSRAFRSATFLS